MEKGYKIESKLREIAVCARSELGKKMDFGLLNGSSGLCLFLSLYTKHIDNTFLPDIHSYLERAITLINKGGGFPARSFYGGIQGFGWLLNFLHNNSIIEKESLDDIDLIAYRIAKCNLLRKNFDFLHGIIGDVYYLACKTDTHSYLNELLTLLDKEKKRNQIGIYWINEYDMVKDNIKVDPCIDLSLSHGLASMICLFVKIAKNYPALKVKATNLLTDLIKFILSTKRTGNGSMFPSFFNNSISSNSRLAWCNGDLGVGYALWIAADYLNDKTLQEESLSILLFTTFRRTQERSGVEDASFCHGSSGIAHMYNKLYNHTHLNEFCESSQFWLDKTLRYSLHDDGIAGYKFVYPEGNYLPVAGILSGISGVGLTLLEFILNEKGVKTSWDECLMLS